MNLNYRAIMVGLVASSLSWSSFANSLSFKEAWQLLQVNNHSLSAQRANIEHYQHLNDAKRSLHLPSVTLGAKYTRLNNDVTLTGQQLGDSLSHVPDGFGDILHLLGGVTSTVSDKDVFSSSIRAVWPIFTGGRISAAQDAAQSQSDEAKSQFEMEVQARYDDLSQYYFQVLLAQKILTTRQGVEQGLEHHLENAIKLEQQGQIALVERLQAQSSYDKAVVERKKSQRNLEIAALALTQILSQNARVEPKDTLFINQNLPPMSTFIEQTLATYPGLTILDEKAKQAQQFIKAEQGKYYPEVFLYGDYSLHEGSSLAAQTKPEWLVGVGVSVPLIDNSGRSKNVQAGYSSVTQVRYLKAQAIQDLTLLVEKTYLEAEQAIEEVIGLKSTVSLAQENLRLRKNSFSQGLANSLDVVDAELYVANIKTQKAVAQFQYLVSLNKLLALSSNMDDFTQYQRLALHNQNSAFSSQSLSFKDPS